MIFLFFSFSFPGPISVNYGVLLLHTINGIAAEASSGWFFLGDPKAVGEKGKIRRTVITSTDVYHAFLARKVQSCWVRPFFFVGHAIRGKQVRGGKWLKQPGITGFDIIKDLPNCQLCCLEIY